MSTLNNTLYRSLPGACCQGPPNGRGSDQHCHDGNATNDTRFGLGAGVWSRNGNDAYRLGRAIQAGRVWTNCHAYPAYAAFGGYKDSGFGRENHRMILAHYQQTKNLLVS